MYRNETGLQVLELGDTVRIGTGKVLYKVTWTPEQTAQVGLFATEVQSHNTGKYSKVELDRLTLVANVRNTEKWKAENETAIPDQTPPGTKPVSDEAWGNGPDTDDANEEEAPVVETSAYQKAVLFALNKLQKHVYAGTVRSNVKAQRRGLNARQKASRKANR